MNSFDTSPEQNDVTTENSNYAATTLGKAQPATEKKAENGPQSPSRRRRALTVVSFVFVAIVASGLLWAMLANKGAGLSEAESQLTRRLEIEVGLETPAYKEKADFVPTDGQLDKENSNSQHDNVSKQQDATAQYHCICDLFDDAPPDSTDHPLDSCLEVARRGLAHIRKNYDDYTASLIKRERINGELGNEEYLFIKIRHEQREGDQVVHPLSVYLKFLAPSSIAGREVIWVEGRNDDRMIVHGTGMTRFFKLNLHPTDRLAMKGNRYPLTEIGVETLALRMLQKGRNDQKHSECEVHIDRGATINDRPCTKIQIVHAEQLPHFEFHIAEIFIDDEYNVPVRYAAYSWPTEKGGDPVLEEEYTYRDLKFNVGLTEKDFDPTNPDYAFP